MNFEIGRPKKENYKFSEVTSVTSVKPYVLRFWETEFYGINPEILEDGTKLYKQRDIDMIESVKDLLFNQKMSIPEAKHFLEKENSTQQESSQDVEVKAFEPEVIQKNTSEVRPVDTSLAIKSKDLKLALEQIIDNYSDPSKVESSQEKESEVIQMVKSNAQSTDGSTNLSDKDIVNLVTAKKKLTGVLQRINEISTKYNW